MTENKQTTWDETYSNLVKLINNSLLFICGKVNCFVREGKHSWKYVGIEKIRSIYHYNGVDEKPIEQIWVTVTDENITTRTLAIPRESNGENTDIMNVEEVFQKIMNLFKELPPRHETPAERLGLPAYSSVKTDEEFANEALE